MLIFNGGLGEDFPVIHEICTDYKRFLTEFERKNRTISRQGGMRFQINSSWITSVLLVYCVTANLF